MDDVVEGEGGAIGEGHGGKDEGGLQAVGGDGGGKEGQTKHKQRPRAKAHVTGVLRDTCTFRGNRAGVCRVTVLTRFSPFSMIIVLLRVDEGECSTPRVSHDLRRCHDARFSR